MSLSSRINDMATEVAAKVVELDKRIPSHTHDDGKITEFHPTDDQILKIAKQVVNVSEGELESLVTDEVFAAAVKLGKKGATK